MIIFFITSFSVRLWSHSEQEAQQHLDHMQLGYCNKNIRVCSNMTSIIKCRHVTTSHLIIYHMRQRPTEAEFQTIYTIVWNSTGMLSKMDSVCSLSIIIINYKLFDTLQAFLSLVIAAFSALNEYQRELIYYCTEYWAVAPNAHLSHTNHWTCQDGVILTLTLAEIDK